MDRLMPSSTQRITAAVHWLTAWWFGVRWQEFAQVRQDFQYPLAAFQAMVEFLLGNRYIESVEAAYRCRPLS